MQRLEAPQIELAKLNTISVDSVMDQPTVATLRARILALEKELTDTRNQLGALEASYDKPKTESRQLPLSLPEYRRYGRQMILDGFGLRCVS